MYYLSSRNLPKAKVVNVKDVNTYELINADVSVLYLRIQLISLELLSNNNKI
jgi:ribosomal protein L4